MVLGPSRLRLVKSKVLVLVQAAPPPTISNRANGPSIETGNVNGAFTSQPLAKAVKETVILPMVVKVCVIGSVFPISSTVPSPKSQISESAKTPPLNTGVKVIPPPSSTHPPGLLRVTISMVGGSPTSMGASKMVL